MDIRALKEEYKKNFLYADGFIRKKTPDGKVYLNDNLGKILSEFYILCKIGGVYFNDDHSRYQTAVKKLWVMSGENTVIGLLTRQPDQPYGSDKDAGEIEQHDDYCFIASGLRVAAEHITNYGNRNWWHFDLRTWADYMEMFRGNLFLCAREWLRTTRQPYQKAIIELQAQGSTDVWCYIHLSKFLLFFNYNIF